MSSVAASPKCGLTAARNLKSQLLTIGTVTIVNKDDRGVDKFCQRAGELPADAMSGGNS
jgi:hypothetical protein